jgi:hypothetical protein
MSSARQDLTHMARAAIMQSMVRLPISTAASDGDLGVLENGTDRFTGDRRVAGKFRNGHWVRMNGQPLGFEPTYWWKLK